jgi:hypothetical protein
MLSPSSIGSSLGGKSSVQYMLVPVQNASQQDGPPQQLSIPAQNQANSYSQRGPYGIQNYGVQNYLPIDKKRRMAPEERADVQRGLSQWWPKIGAGYATPMWELLANPTKSSILNAGLLGTLGGLFGATARHSGIAAAAAGLGALLGGITGFINRRQQNENIIDLMSRLPEGATKRDMLSDPVYQSDLNRMAMARANGGGSDLLTTALLASSLNNYGAARKR